MTYNLTNISSATNFANFFIETNKLVNGSYAILILLALFLMILITMRSYDFFSTLLVASFITIIVASIFVFLSLINWVVFGVILVILVAALVGNIW